MSLLQQVTEEFGGDEDKALDSLSALFMTIRFSLDNAAFEHIQRAVPSADDWVRRAASSGGRTGEMLALTTPASLQSRLERSGLGPDDQARLGSVVVRYLTPLVPAEVLNTLAQKVGILS